MGSDSNKYSGFLTKYESESRKSTSAKVALIIAAGLEEKCLPIVLS
jgi:hypothetical protein